MFVRSIGQWGVLLNNGTTYMYPFSPWGVPLNDDRTYMYPFSDVVERLLVKEEVLESGEWSILVYSSAFLKHVAVSVVIVARRT
jgi:hypothetical protein